MNRLTVIPAHIWEGLSEEARTIIGSVIVGLEQQVAELKQQVQELKARLDQNSTNSSRPPSTDPIGVERRPPTPPSKKRRGGQKGHPRQMRALVPPERVASVTECKPTSCRRCGHALSGEDSEPLRHQVAELPPVEPRSTSTGSIASVARAGRPSPAARCPMVCHARRSDPGCMRPSAC
jgi:transposase